MNNIMCIFTQFFIWHLHIFSCFQRPPISKMPPLPVISINRKASLPYKVVVPYKHSESGYLSNRKCHGSLVLTFFTISACYQLILSRGNPELKKFVNFSPYLQQGIFFMPVQHILKRFQPVSIKHPYKKVSLHHWYVLYSNIPKHLFPILSPNFSLHFLLMNIKYSSTTDARDDVSFNNVSPNKMSRKFRPLDNASPGFSYVDTALSQIGEFIFKTYKSMIIWKKAVLYFFISG